MPEIETPTRDLVPVLPELIVAGVAMVLLVGEAAMRRPVPWLGPAASLLALVGAGVASVSLWSREGPLNVLGGMVTADRFGVFLRLVLLATAATAVGFAHHYFRRTPEDHRSEFYPLLLLCTSGMTLLVVAGNLLMLFLALEVLSLSLYVLTGFSLRRFASQEGAVKYFLLGSFSSAFLLYGIALAYGATGTTSLTGIADALSSQTSVPPLALAAMALLAVGLAFKVAAVPFHMWTPDAYQGAPSPVTAFMSAGTKVAAFGALLRVFMVALHPLQWDWQPLVWGVAAVTMLVGSVLAIAQTDVKRMFAYSSIAHAGFILVGVAAGNPAGISGSLYYLAAYAAMILGGFGIVTVVAGRAEERTSVASYAGLAQRSPVLAALLAVFLLSLAGIPPFAGFVAKVSVFSAAVDAGYWPLALIGVIASVIAAYFYIRIIVVMYMQEPDEAAPVPASPAAGLALAPAAIATLVLGVFPSLLFEVLETASVLRL